MIDPKDHNDHKKSMALPEVNKSPIFCECGWKMISPDKTNLLCPKCGHTRYVKGEEIMNKIKEETGMEFDYQSPDARVWAKAFCKHFPGHDEGTMIGWFANAMMAMYDHVKRQTEIDLYLDGDQYCVLYGPNLQEGIAGFGKTKEEALIDFAKNVLVHKENP